ncbi:hypothetical protein M436DRAFT_45125 [Aureobasidium namibiae CBS 147.97]|uniref:Uncharacterized protein n=1 Tax=Aureobasidium namibiae CBS 147.97 TaxID=1043004 RepID=A0A074XHA6_9PEZI|nr:uncharacterized protein M436DRAFT_45125 [Aureobasidium namibiae CBS 147.97]KEQ73956.1 hypothetical protein M436DRAFT_45125 [Aureobasidium namibiae CBS 147.97]
MASSQSTNELSQKMSDMSVGGKRHVDAPRYTPPHRKYAQANKTVETGTTAPAKDAIKIPTSTPAATENKTTSAATSLAATDKDSEQDPEIKPAPKRIAPHHKYSKPATKVADSWEEEASSEPEPSKAANTTTKPSPDTAPVPKSSYVPPHLKYRSAAPSPPSRSVTPPSRGSTPSSHSTPSSTASSERRPEKTNAVAHRLIAGALGVKVPRRTEEQRAYDKAMREQEKRKRDQEREAKKKAEEDAAKAKAAIWDD